MKGLKGISGFYVSVGVVGLAILASGYFYKREADKAKSLKAEVQRAENDLGGIRINTPTEGHREFLESQKEVIQANFKTIVGEILSWNYVPEEKWTPAKFFGQLQETKNMVVLEAAARDKKIRIDTKAEYLGFDEYKVSPPHPDEEVILQLQRELSAATDIAQLLVASNVHSIDFMARRENALMEEGTTSTALRLGPDLTTTRRRIRLKADLYDIVPFRVRFTCVYPALAQFMKTLITPGKVRLTEFGKVVNRPKNFLVINDFWFTVQGERERELELRRADAEARRKRGLGGIIPDDLPEAAAWYTRNPPEALRFFVVWRTWSPEQKKIWIIARKLKEQISQDERERLQAELNRLILEWEKRERLKDKARPPGYNLIEVTMLIDFVQFKDEDEDGLTDLQEHGLGTDPQKPDTDRDGVDDGRELNVVGTDPLKRDTDGDGVSDGDELASGTDPLRVAAKPEPEESKSKEATTPLTTASK